METYHRKYDKVESIRIAREMSWWILNKLPTSFILRYSKKMKGLHFR